MPSSAGPRARTGAGASPAPLPSKRMRWLRDAGERSPPEDGCGAAAGEGGAEAEAAHACGHGSPTHRDSVAASVGLDAVSRCAWEEAQQQQQHSQGHKKSSPTRARACQTVPRGRQHKGRRWSVIKSCYARTGFTHSECFRGGVIKIR
jgi:hypothetical protein